MQSISTNSTLQGLSSGPRGWNRFWFGPLLSTSLFATRTCIALTSCLVFLLYCLNAENWLSHGGWVNPDAAAQLIGTGIPGTGAEFRLSPYYRTPGIVTLVCCLGMLGSLWLASGRFARLAAFVTYGLLLTLQARAPLFLERGEPLLLACLFYLSLAPSFPTEKLGSNTVTDWGSNKSSKSDLWLGNFSMRLIQVHFVLWIAFSLFSMLGFEGWWTGEAIRQLVEDRQGFLPHALAKLMTLEFIAHSVVLIQIGLLISILSPAIRFAGPILLLLFTAAIILVLGDWVYSLILLATGTSIWPLLRNQPIASAPIHNEA